MSYQSKPHRFIISIMLISLILGFLFIKIFFGLDFTDELQYYGEMYGLLKTGHLFSNDLFIQQTGYLLIYPLLSLLPVGTDLDFFVVLTRSIHALLILVTLGMVYLVYMRQAKDLIGALLALWLVSLSFVNFDIYSPSYNSLSYMLVALILAIWLNSNLKGQAVLLAVLIVSLGWVYPTLGILLAGVIILDLIFTKGLRHASFFVLLLGVSSVLLVTVLLFSGAVEIEKFTNSIAFSKGFHVGGLGNKFHIVLSFYFSMALLAVLLIYVIYHAPHFNLIHRYPSAIFVLGGVFFLIGAVLVTTSWWRFSVIFWFACLFLLFFVIGIEEQRRSTITRILIMAVSVSLVSALTSGNGFTVLFRGFFLALGFIYFEIVCSSIVSKNPSISLKNVYQVGATLSTMIILVMLTHPYRDLPIWNLSAGSGSAPAFKGISISPEKKAAIDWARSELKEIPKDGHLLIVGAQPWIYFVTEANMDTDMVFMHFRGSDVAFAELAENLVKRQPEYILITVDEMPDSIRNALDLIMSRKVYKCHSKNFDSMLNEHLFQQTSYEIPERVSLCKIINT